MQDSYGERYLDSIIFWRGGSAERGMNDFNTKNNLSSCNLNKLIKNAEFKKDANKEKSYLKTK